MSAQVYSVPGQTEGRREAFLEWKSIDLSYELSFTCGGNVNYYKSVHHPVSTCENREHPSNFQNKSVNSAFKWVSRYILFLTELKGRGTPFLKGAIRGATLWDYSQEHLVVIRDDCSGKNSSNSSCQCWTYKSIHLQVVHHSVMTHNSPVNFKLIQFPLWIKGSHQSLNF